MRKSSPKGRATSNIHGTLTGKTVNHSMDTARFNYRLPPELLATEPAANRSESRLFHFRRSDRLVEHRVFSEIVDILRPEDLLVRNVTRVNFARFHGVRAATGGKVEVLFQHPCDADGRPYPQRPYSLDDERIVRWLALTHSGGRLQTGEIMELPGGFSVTIEKRLGWDGDVVSVSGNLQDFRTQLVPDDPSGTTVSEIPLPPYIIREIGTPRPRDRTRYQTVYARVPGAVAAPTAGLHFTPEIFGALENKGVDTADLTLHVGAGTFRPVKSEDISGHEMHAEWFSIPEETAEAIKRARKRGGRIVAVGTTSLRALESAAREDGRVAAGEGWTRIFIHPPAVFKTVDVLITNFHLPKSTLIMLAAAFLSPGETTGADLVLELYREAIRRRYRFFSYGDCMLLE